MSAHHTMAERARAMDDRSWEKGGLRRTLMAILDVDVEGAWSVEADLVDHTYTRHRVSLNHRSLQMDADGGFEVIVAARDPGHPNWLNAAGHDNGFLIARSLLLQEDALPDIQVEMLHARELISPAGVS